MASSCTCGANGEQSKKKLSKRVSKKTSNNEKKNPYSDRGIDKFKALLEEVEEKKRLIYTQLNPEDVSMIRFVQSGDNKLRPVVVTASNKAFKLKALPSKMMVENEDDDKLLVEEGSGDGGKDRVQVKEEEIEIRAEGEEEEKKKKKKKKVNLPWIYMLGGMVILVLVLMAMFERYWKTFYLLQLQKTICPSV